ncbi:hypothetical protein DM02DRAFT_556207 [Periconia macrospinosa]|uniref:RING-type domain-containing protein n=1 Tax=Periconia macrospinosa TaxID=97972 RepID=A0A2V1E1F0_9PLEO|nr:hypothetical protein DM02DRAFT_556207 [Periconia macrospinosa]
MGTLTADCPRLETHCPHKLATSCRLTSTPNCCACADERPHSRLYRVYIDGVGFVQRGTRWQSYCWFCKEFWNNRLLATDPPLEASQTRIPSIPDQTEFLERWFEFHQGYRIVNAADGTEIRIAVIGEPFHDVSPGLLPRTVEELRAGRPNDASRPENRTRRRRLTSEEQRPQGPQQSIEDALDSLLNEISDDDIASPAPPDQPDQPTLEQTPAQTPAQAMNLPDDALNATETNLSNLRLIRARERLTRVFGTREDVQREDYESPLSTLYNRAEARYQQAEARRATGDTTAPSTDGMSARERQNIEEQILWGVLTESRSAANQAGNQSGDPTEISNSTLDALVARITRNRRIPRPPSPTQTLDNPERPPPLTEAQMTKNLACQVCYVQIANIAVVPCGHMVMCQWCADVVVPVRHNHFPARPSKCPMCRKGIKQRFKIHTAA